MINESTDNPVGQSLPPAGWYNDPAGGAQRFWNGTVWEDNPPPKLIMDKSRVNRTTYASIVALFFGLFFALLAIANVVFQEPRVELRIEDGTTENFSQEWASAGEGCSASLTDPECIAFWTSRGFERKNLEALDGLQDKRNLTVLPAFLLLPAYIAASIRRHHDCGRPGWWMFVPLAGPILVLVNLFQPGESKRNAYGSPPRKGIAWNALICGRSEPADSPT